MMRLERVSMLLIFSLLAVGCTKPNEAAVQEVVASEPVKENKIFSYDEAQDVCIYNDGSIGYNESPVPSECVDSSGAILDQSDLSGHNLRGANFEYASLKNVNFTNSDLTGANFNGANLQGAILDGTTLQKTKIQLPKVDRIVSPSPLSPSPISPSLSGLPKPESQEITSPNQQQDNQDTPGTNESVVDSDNAAINNSEQTSVSEEPSISPTVEPTDQQLITESDSLHEATEIPANTDNQSDIDPNAVVPVTDLAPENYSVSEEQAVHNNYFENINSYRIISQQIEDMRINSTAIAKQLAILQSHIKENLLRKIQDNEKYQSEIDTLKSTQKNLKEKIQYAIKDRSELKEKINIYLSLKTVQNNLWKSKYRELQLQAKKYGKPSADKKSTLSKYDLAIQDIRFKNKNDQVLIKELSLERANATSAFSSTKKRLSDSQSEIKKLSKEIKSNLTAAEKAELWSKIRSHYKEQLEIDNKLFEIRKVLRNLEMKRKEISKVQNQRQFEIKTLLLEKYSLYFE